MMQKPPTGGFFVPVRRRGIACGASLAAPTLARQPALFCRHHRAVQHLLSIHDLTPAQLAHLSDPNLPAHGPPAVPWGVLGALFEQPSLRTASSFAAAAVQLGLAPVFVDTRGHSLRAGLTLEDEVLQLAHNAACVVVRCAQPLQRALLQNSLTPVVNAGDGDHEHPTQALLDLCTLRHFGLRGKTVTLMGNLRDHRSQHSLALALRAWPELGALQCISPPGLGLPAAFGAGVAALETYAPAPVDRWLQRSDFVYLTPVQSWRTPQLDTPTAFRLDAARAQRVLRAGTRVLHPFPRHDELAHDLDNTAFNGYSEQLRRAVPVRRRLLQCLLSDTA
jgi:aspartate carbamoyltransferase catalytic subunit